MKKKYGVLLAILVVLIALRLSLPTLVKHYVNKTLSELDGYTGSVADIDIALYRGAYRIDDLQIFSTDRETEEPFFSAQAIDLSLRWKDLFKGRIVGEVILVKPILTFQTTADADSVVTGENVDWTEPIKDLIPISINLFAIEDGRIAYADPYSSPPVDVYLDDFDFRLENIRNTDDKENPLPSPFQLSAIGLGGGVLTMDGKANLLKTVPDFDLNLSFENADLTAFNTFFKAYAWFDFEKGDFSLYSELALVDSSLDGYFKPILNDVKVVDWNEEEEGFFNKLYQSVVGGATELFENQKEDQTATEVPVSGSLDATKVGVGTALVEVLKNAFVRPLRKTLEQRIAVQGSKIVDQGAGGDKAEAGGSSSD